MLTPTRIEVRNVRSIEHAVVEPLADGLTAFSGTIGSGKSTVMNALLWNLYGEVGAVPGALVQAEMRRSGCPEREPVEVVVDFELNGDTFRSVRSLRRRHRAGKATEKAEAELWVNGAKQSQITPAKLTDKVTSLTGLSGRAYAGAFFCAQFHLPALADGTPADVQKMVEDQTGLSLLTRRIDAARTSAKDAEVAADALPGSRAEVESAQVEVDTAQKEGDRLWQAFEVAQARAEKTRDVWESKRDAHTALVSQQRAAERAKAKSAEVRARIEQVAAQLAELKQEARSLPQVDAAEVRATADRLRGGIGEAQRSRQVLETAAAAASDAAAAETAAEKTVAALPSDAEERASAAAAQVTALQGELGALHGEYQRLTRAIDTIRASGPDTADCPTCAQRLDDAHQLLVDLLAQRDSTSQRGARVREQAATAETAAKATAQAARERAHALADVERRRADATAAKARHQTAHAAAMRVLDDLRHVVGADRVENPAALIETAQQMLDDTSSQMWSAERAATVAQQIARHQATVADLETSLADATVVAGDDVDDETVVVAETAAQQAHAGHAVEEAARQTAETEAKVAAERVRSAEAARDRAVALLDAKADALADADTKRHAAHLLAALRKDLLADYTATISDAATQLIQQVGGNDHVGVVIDETFIPRVLLATGEERPMRVLSGGEKMRAALCLRLGIADQIVGGTGQGMVFADEITANQDEETTQEIVDLIRNLGRPMVLIAHAPQVTQIANRVYEFTKPDEQSGSTVARAGTLAPAP